MKSSLHPGRQPRPIEKENDKIAIKTNDVSRMLMQLAHQRLRTSHGGQPLFAFLG